MNWRCFDVFYCSSSVTNTTHFTILFTITKTEERKRKESRSAGISSYFIQRYKHSNTNKTSTTSCPFFFLIFIVFLRFTRVVAVPFLRSHFFLDIPLMLLQLMLFFVYSICSKWFDTVVFNLFIFLRYSFFSFFFNISWLTLTALLTLFFLLCLLTHISCCCGSVVFFYSNTFCDLYLTFLLQKKLCYAKYFYVLPVWYSKKVEYEGVT